MTSYRIPEKEHNALLQQIARNRGKFLHDSFRIGQKVSYRGVFYTLLDHIAEGNSSLPVIVSANWQLVSGVEWNDLRIIPA